MNIRQLRTEEFESKMALSQFAFQYVLTPEQLEQRRQAFVTEQEWGAFDDSGSLMSALSIHPLEVWIQGRKVKMGGIGSVATWPEARRQGCVRQLLVHALETMKSHGQMLSMLHPFSFSFYRKYGWELTVERKKYTIDMRQLPARRDVPGEIRRLDKLESGLLEGIYSAYASSYNGTLTREKKWWDRRVLAKPGIAAVYYNEQNTPEGYVYYQLENRKLTIHEWASVSEQARAALWSFIGNHDSMAIELEMIAPQDDPLPFLLDDPRIKQEIIPYFMSRIVDVEAFSQAYSWSPGSADAVGLSLADEHAPWNNGDYLLSWDADGGGRLEKLASAAVGAITCDIQALTAMLVGNRKPSWMLEVGRIGGTAEDVELLERKILVRTPYLMDFF